MNVTVCSVGHIMVGHIPTQYSIQFNTELHGIYRFRLNSPSLFATRLFGK